MTDSERDVFTAKILLYCARSVKKRLTYLLPDIRITCMVKVIRNLILLGLVFLIGYIFGIKEVRFFEVISSSMEPTLRVGDRIATVKKGRLKRGDIVLLQAPVGDNEKLTKRIIGLPYETVEIKDRKVFINGEELYESYVKDHPVYTLKAETGENGYFLLGDNRNESEDSSRWGPVDEESIIGRVFCRYWPFKDFKLFTSFSISIREE